MKQSAGIIIVDEKNAEPLVLCVRAYSNWDFPKGQVESGESLIEAAIRETEEETTLQIQKDYQLTGMLAPSITYGKGKSEKTATYFLAKKASDKSPFLPVNPELGHPENDEWKYLPISELSFTLPKRLQPVINYLQKLYSFVQN